MRDLLKSKMLHVYHVLVLLCLLYVLALFLRLIILPYFIYRKLAQQVPFYSFIPLVGHAKEINASQQAGRSFLLPLQQAKEKGPVFVTTFLTYVQLRLNDDTYLSEVLRTKNEAFTKTPFMFKLLGPLIGCNNLLMETGQVHHGHRCSLSPAFRHHQLLRMMVTMSSTAQRHVDRWLQENTGATIQLHKLLSSLTLDVISAAAFGAHIRQLPGASGVVYNVLEQGLMKQNWRISHLLETIPLVNRLPFFQKPQVDQAGRAFRTLVDSIIAKRKTSLHYERSDFVTDVDFLGLLLNSNTSEENNGLKFTFEEVRDQTLLMVFAGHETVSTACLWTLTYLCLHRLDLWKAVREEVRSIIGLDITEVTLQQLSQLKVTEAVFCEAMRLFPPVPVIARQATQDVMLQSKNNKSSLFVPRGTLVYVVISAIHRSPFLWDNPDVFDHTRWLRNSLPNPFAFLPFSIGPHNCLGRNFAMLEAKIILINIISKCHMKFVHDQPLIELMPAMTVVATLRPLHGVRVTLSN